MTSISILSKNRVFAERARKNLCSSNTLMEKLQNKTAFITGGTSGIGLATAQDFIKEGARVIISGRYQDTVNATLAMLGDRASGIVSDAGSMTDLMNLQEQVRSISGVIDILFINAGYGRFAPVEAVTESDIDELFNVIVKGAFFTAQQILPLMNAGGSIIFNTSVVTEYGSQYASVYSAAKSAVKSFVKTFAAECVSRGIRVNGVSPGYTTTNGFDKTGLSKEQIEGTIAAVIPTLPFRRFGLASEVAKTVSFLASDDASYLHATDIVVDGGYINLK
jgi:NAD(P)-dependent dehydrogenase (short-subunit alcohol dehydrogenase family)